MTSSKRKRENVPPIGNILNGRIILFSNILKPPAPQSASRFSCPFSRKPRPVYTYVVAVPLTVDPPSLHRQTSRYIKSSKQLSSFLRRDSIGPSFHLFVCRRHRPVHKHSNNERRAPRRGTREWARTKHFVKQHTTCKTASGYVYLPGTGVSHP